MIYEAEVNLKFFIEKIDQPILRSANQKYEDIEVTRRHDIVGVLVGLVGDGAGLKPEQVVQ